MPEGYQCDKCDTFSKHTHNATKIEFGSVNFNYADDPDAKGKAEKIVCPDCGQDYYNDITNHE